MTTSEERLEELQEEALRLEVEISDDGEHPLSFEELEQRVSAKRRELDEKEEREDTGTLAEDPTQPDTRTAADPAQRAPKYSRPPLEDIVHQGLNPPPANQINPGPQQPSLSTASEIVAPAPPPHPPAADAPSKQNDAIREELAAERAQRKVIAAPADIRQKLNLGEPSTADFALARKHGYPVAIPGAKAYRARISIVDAFTSVEVPAGETILLIDAHVGNKAEYLEALEGLSDSELEAAHEDDEGDRLMANARLAQGSGMTQQPRQATQRPASRRAANPPKNSRK